VKLDCSHTFPPNRTKQPNSITYNFFVMTGNSKYRQTASQGHVMLANIFTKHESFAIVHEDLDMIFRSRMVFLDDHI
jgi:hypothetical protein